MNKLGPSWVREFHEQGWCVARNCLDEPTIQAFVAQIASELDAGVAAGACSARLDEPATWPRAGARRVLEVSPAAASKPHPLPVEYDSDDDAKLEPRWMAHWSALRAPGSRVALALDALLGEGCWELPFNWKRSSDKPASADSSNAVAIADVDAPVQSSGASNGARLSDGGVAHGSTDNSARSETAHGSVEAQVEFDSSFDPLHWYCPVVFPERTFDGVSVNVKTGNGSARAIASESNKGKTKADQILFGSTNGHMASERRRGGSGGGGGGDDARKRRKAAVREERERRLEAKRLRQRARENAAAAASRAILEASGCKADSHDMTKPGNGAGTSSCDRARHSCGRPLLFCAWHEDESVSTASMPVSPGECWQPVNRRRVRGKGWHIDWGPGFEKVGKGVRTLEGHPYQGVIILIMLSDWQPGGGGTVVIPGSHEWVRKRIQHAVDSGADGVPQAELNEWCKARVRADAERHMLLLPRSTDSPVETSSSGVADATDCGITYVQQMVGRAGDVVFLHPWLIHSGSTNYSQVPRLMANGCARVKPHVFEREGCRVLQKLGAES